MKNFIVYWFLVFSFIASGHSALNAPKTLFELTGVEKPNIKLQDSILVIIDAQKEYQSGKLPLPGVEDTILIIGKVLSEARKLKIPIIHVLHEGPVGGLFDPATVFYDSISGLSPLANESLIRKHFPDAFAGTLLLKELERIGGQKTLIFTGFMTHMCINSTASTALSLGFQSAILQDAVATRNLKGANDQIIQANLVNQVILASLKDRISWIIKSDDILSKN